MFYEIHVLKIRSGQRLLPHVVPKTTQVTAHRDHSALGIFLRRWTLVRTVLVPVKWLSAAERTLRIVHKMSIDALVRDVLVRGVLVRVVQVRIALARIQGRAN